MKATKKPVTIECFKYDGDLKNKNGEYYVPEWALNTYSHLLGADLEKAVDKIG